MEFYVIDFPGFCVSNVVAAAGWFVAAVFMVLMVIFHEIFMALISASTLLNSHNMLVVDKKACNISFWARLRIGICVCC